MRKEVERIMRNIVRNQAKQPQSNQEPKVTTFILKHWFIHVFNIKNPLI
jgi:hypothetical protein